MLTKIKLFLAFLKKFITNRFNNKAIVASIEIQDERLNMCDGCPYRSENMCMACGCNLNLKVRFQDSECPVGCWAR